MIRAIECVDASRACVPWWPKVPFLATRPRVEFAPGLNIIFGPNGSGKSTLLRAIARTLHCEQGGAPLLTETSVARMARLRVGEHRDEVLDGLRVEHDGRIIGYFHADATPGLAGGAWDNDFFVAGVRETMVTSRASSGQANFHRLARAMTLPCEPLRRKIREEHVNSLWAARLRACDAMLAPTGEAGPPTVILDEPERSLDLLVRPRLWRRIEEASRLKQVLVATHDVFSLFLGVDTNVIETQDGYASACRDVVITAIGGGTCSPT